MRGKRGESREETGKKRLSVWKGERLRSERVHRVAKYRQRGGQCGPGTGGTRAESRVWDRGSNGRRKRRPRDGGSEKCGAREEADRRRSGRHRADTHEG